MMKKERKEKWIEIVFRRLKTRTRVRTNFRSRGWKNDEKRKTKKKAKKEKERILFLEITKTSQPILSFCPTRDHQFLFFYFLLYNHIFPSFFFCLISTIRSKKDRSSHFPKNGRLFTLSLRWFSPKETKRKTEKRPKTKYLKKKKERKKTRQTERKRCRAYQIFQKHIRSDIWEKKYLGYEVKEISLFYSDES